jgi:hypothetical protein
MARQPSTRNEESQTARERAIEAYDGARRKAAGGIEESPLLALAGGLAAGAALAALIPAGRKERELLGPVAGKIKDRAGDALSAAKDAGQARLDELGLTRDKGTDALRSIVEGAGDAAKASAEAAVASFRGPQD